MEYDNCNGCKGCDDKDNFGAKTKGFVDKVKTTAGKVKDKLEDLKGKISGEQPGAYSDEPKPEEPQATNWMLIGGVVVVLAVIGIALYLRYKK